jgi:hypothetical protein
LAQVQINGRFEGCRCCGVPVAVRAFRMHEQLSKRAFWMHEHLVFGCTSTWSPNARAPGLQMHEHVVSRCTNTWSKRVARCAGGRSGLEGAWDNGWFTHPRHRSNFLKNAKAPGSSTIWR